METRLSGTVKVRFVWDKEAYEKDFFYENKPNDYAEPDIQLIIGEIKIPAESHRIGSNVWDTFLSIYQALSYFDKNRLVQRKELRFVISDDYEELPQLSFDERVYDVCIYPTDDENLLHIKYEALDYPVVYDSIILPLKDFVRGILESNIEFFDQVRSIY
jgi:hypothetical protein